MRDTRIRLLRGTPFGVELRRRVDAYFATTGRATHGGRALVVKTILLFAWLVAALAIFLYFGGPWLAVACGLAVGLAMGGLGMAVQHDAGHGAYSANGRVNRLAAAVLDLLGASSFIWRVKHGQLHHTYPNVVGADDDIELAPWLRLAPAQPRRWFHRAQHVYAFALYGALGLKWFLWDDFAQIARGRVGRHPIARPRGWDAALFWGGKAAYLVWAIALPVAVNGWLAGLLFLVISQITMGVLLSTIFQLAHCVEEATIVDPDDARGLVDLDFCEHQLATTVDFGRGNRWLGWYWGGLDFQAVHHLFPRISHVHYPALSHVVERVCSEFGVAYNVSPGIVASLRSHVRWLRRMGREANPCEERRVRGASDDAHEAVA